MDTAPVIETMRIAARALTSGDVREKLRAVQTLQDALDATKALLLAELKVSKDFELDGASTLNTWVRNELRLKSGAANALVRNVTALEDLPLVADVALAGRISAAHVSAFVYGLKHVGLDLMRQHEETLVAVALEEDPSALFEAVKYLQARTHPEDLDAKYEQGMDKEDFQVDSLPDGWHVTGFLGTTTGAKLKKVLDSVSAPTDKDDARTGAERRVQGLDDLLTAILANGLPSDKGVKPHMSVFVDADTLEAAAEHVKQTTENPFVQPAPMPDTEPATLAGHGHIGPSPAHVFLVHLRLHRVLDESWRWAPAGADPQRRPWPLSAQSAATQGCSCPTKGCLRDPRMQPHTPRNPPRDLVLPRRGNRPRSAHRVMRQMPPPGSQAAFESHRQRSGWVRIHQGERPPTPTKAKNRHLPSRLTAHRPAAHRHAYVEGQFRLSGRAGDPWLGDPAWSVVRRRGRDGA